ncbi:tetratricopeptide repeat protein [Viridibacillus sp. NPDC093762]|uniref:tetratricopeptide repeat protein n=1 Tax=Viridibacillus sp. NPDC093762 TaxID=3390720 RepID=UPI003D0531D7
MQRLEKVLKLRAKNLLRDSNQLMMDIHRDYPEDGLVNYQTAWSLDVLGLENEAIPYYEKAILLGLNNQDEPNAYLGLGSTYRTIGEYQKSEKVLQEGITKYPDFKALQVFYAMTLFNLKKHEDSIGQLLDVIISSTKDESIKEYERAIHFYKDKLHLVW